MLDTAITTPTKGPPFRGSLITLLAGLAVGIPCALMVLAGFWPLLFGSSYAVPGALELDLGQGRYVVFERTGSQRNFGVVRYSTFHGVTIDHDDVEVINENGTTVPVYGTNPNETITRNNESFVSAVEFHVPRDGTYTVEVRSDDPTRVVVEHPMGAVIDQRRSWVAGAVLGWVATLAGMTLLLTGVIRRGRASRRAREAAYSVAIAASVASTPPAVAPAGWFADPMHTATWRYWDGTRWTEHTAN